MLSGSELKTAIAAVLIGAVLTGILLHWFWTYLNRSRSSDSFRLGEMAARLHEADMARAAAEEAQQRAETRLARREADLAERQARPAGSPAGREAELTEELAAARLELETMRARPGKARKRVKKPKPKRRH